MTKFIKIQCACGKKTVVENDDGVMHVLLYAEGVTSDIEAGEPTSTVNDKHPHKKPKKEKSAGGGKIKKVRLCKGCGKPGHRSDNCPDNTPADEDPVENGPKNSTMTPGKFDGIKKLFDLEWSALSIADEVGCSLQSVNRVRMSTDFAYFQKHFM